MNNNENCQALSANPTTGQIKFGNIETLRFLFSILIVYMHFTHHKAVESLYLIQGHNDSGVRFIVEFFFIIAGFFLFYTFKNKKQTWIQFVKKKIARLWPSLAFYSLIIIILLVFFGIQPPFNAGLDVQIFNIMFLQNIGLTPDAYGYNWFISSYFWTIIFYFYILKNFDIKYANLIIALCVYFSLVVNLNCSNFTLYGIETTYYNFFNAGLLRALTGIGIGYFIGIFYSKAKNYITAKSFDNLKTFIILTIIEVFCSFYLIKYLLFEVNYKNALIFLIMFSILFFTVLIKKGAISKILDNKYFAFLGRYSYSIYVMQGITFLLLESTLWKTPYFIIHTKLTSFITLITAVILGILAYHIAEKPLSAYLKKKFNV